MSNELGAISSIAQTPAIAAAKKIGVSQKPMTLEQIKIKGQEYEAQLLGTMLNQMSSTVGKEDDPFHAGQAEDTWRGMLNEEYGKIIAKSGGIGLADSVVHELVRMQAKSTMEPE